MSLIEIDCLEGPFTRVLFIAHHHHEHETRHPVADILDLRKPEKLAIAVGYLLTWLRGDASSQQAGLGLGRGRSTEDALNYIRGGPSAFRSAPTGVAFWSIKQNTEIKTTADYRNAIATIYSKLRGNAGDWNDGTGLAEAGNLYHNNIRITIIVVDV